MQVAGPALGAGTSTTSQLTADGGEHKSEDRPWTSSGPGSGFSGPTAEETESKLLLHLEVKEDLLLDVAMNLLLHHGLLS